MKMVWYHWSNIFTQTWLLYSLIIPVHKYRFNSPITVKYEKPLMEFNESTSFMLMVPYHTGHDIYHNNIIDPTF